jgi:hypothetical protein
MKRQRLMFSVVTCLWLAGMAYGAPPKGSANVKQTELTSSYTCGFTFTPVPIDVTLTTAGGPVLLSLTVNVYALSGTGNATLAFAIDGQTLSAQALVGSADTYLLMSPSRVVEVPAGVHTFGAMLACTVNDMTVGNAWLSAYELPLIRK